MPTEPDDVNKVPGNIPDETGSIDTSPDSYPPPVGDLSYKKPSSRKKWLVIVVVLLLIAAIAGAVYYFVSLANSSKETNKTPVAQATKFSSPNALVTTAAAPLEGQMLDTKTATGLGGVTPNGVSTYSLPAYQVDGKKFKNQPVEGSGAGYYGNSATAKANYTLLTNFFKNNHFTQVTSRSDGTGPLSASSEVTFVSYTEYGSDDMLCAVWNADATQTELKAYVASIGCATKESYKKAADTLDPFYTAYTKQNKDAANLVFGDPVLSNGKDGYKNVVMYQEDPRQVDSDADRAYFSGFYYQAPNSNEWTFFTGVGISNLLSCSAFNTSVLKQAFSGLNCYDDATKKSSTV